MRFVPGDTVTFNTTHPEAPALWMKKLTEEWGRPSKLEGNFKVTAIEEVPHKSRDKTGHDQWVTIENSPGYGDTFSGLYFETDEYITKHYGENK